jgi:HAD superfamily hydrolase (TIGR01509 family)
MMGMSSTEWSRYMNEELGVKMPPEEISAAVVKRMEELYREHLPLIPGAHEAVERVAAWWPLGLASSANRPVIEVVLELSGLGDFFETTVSSEEVARGKPAPDVYLEAARQLRADPTLCAAVEDSSSGILSAHAAGMRVVAIPNRTFPPSEEALKAADAAIPSLQELQREVIDSGV